MREFILSDLVKEVLGPRKGIHEVMHESPREEYITGVLAPRSVITERDPETEATMVIEEVEGEDFYEEEDCMDSPPVFSSTLNPQEIPHSMGVSFCLKCITGQPKIRLCLTWARYIRQDDSGWRRKPRAYVSDNLTVTEKTLLLLDEQGQEVSEFARAEISLYLRGRSIGPDTFHVSIYLVNEVSSYRQKATPGEYIFQPQIRIVCGENTFVCQYLSQDITDMDEEDRETEFLYRKIPVLARGHLCSAVWKEIDPGKPLSNDDDYVEVPFGWPDGELVKNKYGVEVFKEFVIPDIRSEFVPIYSVKNPDFSWKGSVSPELDPEKLADTWDPGDIRSKLMPIVDGYRAWIKDQENEVKLMRGKEAKIAQKLIDRCKEVTRRIKNGIDILVNDPESRLCFCLANRAIYLQARWANPGRKLIWRPFQLAFILMTLESIANPSSTDREVCDLLWVPTGGGKTEAYLAIIAFTIALRRRRALGRTTGNKTGSGVSVITRYTLRLLTIQQFRRALRIITACEYLRVYGMDGSAEIGWRPPLCNIRGNFIWGTTRFSVGLWVGGSVTPNRLSTIRHPELRTPIYGAIDILKGEQGEGEPAQVLECPACQSFLAFPDNEGVILNQFELNLVVFSKNQPPQVVSRKTLNSLGNQNITVTGMKVFQHTEPGYFTFKFQLRSPHPVTSKIIDQWWRNAASVLGVTIVSARASRPGYFIRKYYPRNSSHNEQEYDFDIFCTNPECPLHMPWTEGQPAGYICDNHVHSMSPTIITRNGTQVLAPDGNKFMYVHKSFRLHSPHIADRIPIPAFTVDSQVYARCPSMVVATVDKFARLPFEPRTAALFGNVEYHHCLYGYYRENLISPDCTEQRGHPSPAGSSRQSNYVAVSAFDPPDLIIQDELHLIEGPLGSLVGLYETAVDYLCISEMHPVKYIASTATVTKAAEQVRSVFNRRLLQFPPPGIDIRDRFFLRTPVAHPKEDKAPGRLYVGICAPGRGPLTPVIRIWARLLQSTYELAGRYGDEIDPYWTLVGYFNAIRELAGARATYWQDIPERLRHISGTAGSRRISDDAEHLVELSGRTKSTELPALLDMINSRFSGNPAEPNTPDALFTTSMFGTGVDIPRLGLMVVHGQPKTTSAYIQSTGRVGRGWGALVVTFYRATRPRDMSHYEMFCGYHQALGRFVEPVTVSPYSPGALERAAGPVATAILRNMPSPTSRWYTDDSAYEMREKRRTAPEVLQLPDILEARAQTQPSSRRPPSGYCHDMVASELDRWETVAHAEGSKLRYVEYFNCSCPVVLGDPQHQHANLRVVFRNAPQSLREIEETITFQTS
ncbi:hypothetical protein MTCOM_05730 [Moorella thermoacetica]|uniref:DISARM system helicase DrmA n=1 Tax=Neomoorella thermoacetica TaxID=1525 RepID=UPI0008FA387A|nr:DISARM system helicase DrmA [Moorella thermoacetica]OIQ10638.1 hypothetical protein MOOTH_24750 [Moorella thermoacetica]